MYIYICISGFSARKVRKIGLQLPFGKIDITKKLKLLSNINIEENVIHAIF